MEESKKRKLSRREFLRLAGLGLGSAAVATTAAGTESSPAAKQMAKHSFSDPAGRPNRPWWVKTVDEPTTEIDYNVYERFSEQLVSVRGPGLGIHGGAELPGQLAEEGAKLKMDRLKNETPGWALRDNAIYNAQMWKPLRIWGFPNGPVLRRKPPKCCGQRCVTLGPRWSHSTN